MYVCVSAIHHPCVVPAGVDEIDIGMLHVLILQCVYIFHLVGSYSG